MTLSLLLLVACVSKYESETDVPPRPDPVFVGPQGGTFDFGDVEITFPQDAIAESIEIRIFETADDPPAEYDALSKVWSFEPHGLIFAQPVSVRLPFSPADTERPRLYWSNDDFGYDRISGEVLTPGLIGAEVAHFSTAFVAQVGSEIVAEPSPYPPADVLFVVDNSCSMIEEQTALADAFPTVLPNVVGTGLDFHVGVVSTDMEDTVEGQGKLRIAQGFSYIDPLTPDPESVFTQMALIGTAGWYEEKGRAAAYTMVEIRPDIPRNVGFYREEASLTLIFVSDEEDQSGSTPVTVQEFNNWMDQLKSSPGEVRAHGFITPPGTSCPEGDTPGAQYAAVINHTGGVVASLCEPDWAPLLETMLDGLLDTARVVLPDPASEIVEVTFVVGSQRTVLDPTEYRYDANAQTVFFDRGTRPGVDDVVEVEYLPL